MPQEDPHDLRSVTAKLDTFWMALAEGKDEDVGKYLAQFGFTDVFDGLNDLLEAVGGCAQDLRERHEIETAVEMEKLAEEIASYLRLQ